MRWLRRTRGRSRPPRDVDTALRRALLATLQHDLAGAEQLLAQAVRLDSSCIDAYLALGRLYRSRGEVGRAIQLHQGLLVHPQIDAEQRVDALAELAADFQKGGFLRRAIASWEEVLSHRPRDAEALRQLVRLLASVRDYERAIECGRRLARLEGRPGGAEEASLLVEMAAAAQAEGRSADARKALKRALRRDGRCVAAWIVLGALEAERGRTRATLAAWTRVPRLDRRRGPEVYERLEATFAAAGRAREFETFLQQLLKEEPDDAAARLALGRALAARGESEQALKEIRRVVDAAVDPVEAHCALGRVLLADHRDEEARAAYADLLESLERRATLRAEELFE